MNHKFTFSVVIPTWNIQGKIAKTLDSLVGQTFKDFEVIVSDDGSKDETLKVVEKYIDKLNLKILANEGWGGPARPRNIAIKESNADWIAFLDHDDWWYPTKLEEILKFLENSDVIFHDLDIFGGSEKPTGRIRGFNLGEDAFRTLMVSGNAIANSGATVRKSLLEQVGYVDESKDIVAVPDYDLWLKIGKVTNRFKFVDKSLGGYWLEAGQNMTAATEKQIKMYETIYKKWSSDLKPKDQILALALVDYFKARIYHKLKKYPEAKKSYFSALRSSRTDIKVKSLAGLGLTAINK